MPSRLGETEASFDMGRCAVVGAGLSLRGAAQGVETESSAWDARGAGFNNPGMDAGLGVGDSKTAVDGWETRAGEETEAQYVISTLLDLHTSHLCVPKALTES